MGDVRSRNYNWNLGEQVGIDDKSIDNKLQKVFRKWWYAPYKVDKEKQKFWTWYNKLDNKLREREDLDYAKTFIW